MLLQDKPKQLLEDKPKQAMTYINSILKNRDITLPTKVLIDKAPVFQQSCKDVRVGSSRTLSTELMLSNCVVGEDS